MPRLRWTTACALAALALLAVPASQAVDYSAEADWVLRPDVGHFVEFDIPDTVQERDVLSARGCGDGHITIDPVRQSFDFRERTEETGCAEARLNLTVPLGARTLEVRFRADRRIQQAGSTTPLGDTGVEGPPAPILAIQRTRCYCTEARAPNKVDYFGAQDGSHAPEPHNATFAIQPPSVALGWLFEDRGYATSQNLAAGLGQAVSATVGDIQLRLPNVPYDGYSFSVSQPNVDGGRQNQTISIRFTLDEAALQGVETLRFHTPLEDSVSAMRTPNGPYPARNLTRVIADDVRTLPLNRSFFLAHGAGTYVLELVRTTPAPLGTVVVPADPFSFSPFQYLIMALAVFASGLADGRTGGYFRRSDATYRTGARILFLVALALTAYLATLLVYAFLALPETSLHTLPLTQEGLLFYAQVLVLGILFLALGSLGRSQQRTMLEERREQALRARHAAELERSNRELEHFATVASHDLQEPLRKVASFTKLLQERYHGRLDRDADTYIDYAADGAVRMQALIRDLLTYSRVGQEKVPNEPVDCNEIMRSVASDLEERLRAERGRLTWDRLPTVQGGATLLRQVFFNLVQNGVKYRHRRRPPHVHVAAEELDNAWRFTVSDNGIGIGPEEQGKLFQLFRRLHARAAYPGTGIGLALCKRIVELHGGLIGLLSVPGKGSTFHFTIPKVQPKVNP